MPIKTSQLDPADSLTASDLIQIVAVDDDTMGLTGTNKKITAQAFAGDLLTIGGFTSYVHPDGDGNMHVPATSTDNGGKVLTAGETAGALSWTSLPATYVHPDGDGNLHVPATLTTNEGKVLTAGATAGSLNWSADFATKGYVDDRISTQSGVFKFPEKNNAGGIVLPMNELMFVDSSNILRTLNNSYSLLDVGDRVEYTYEQSALPAQMIGSADPLYNIDKLYVNSTLIYVLTNEGNVFGSASGTDGTRQQLVKLPLTEACTKIVLSIETPIFRTISSFLTASGKLYINAGSASEELTQVIGPGNTRGNPTEAVVDIQIAGHGETADTAQDTWTLVALLSNGTVWTSGSNYNGQLGNISATGGGNIGNVWVQVKNPAGGNLTDISKIYVVGREHLWGNFPYTFVRISELFALSSSNELFRWGDRFSGGWQVKSFQTDVINFWAFNDLHYYKKTDNKIYKQLSLYGSGMSLVPELSSYDIENLWGPSSFNYGDQRFVFAKVAGSNMILASGNNAFGQLGDGTKIDSTDFKLIYFPITSPIVDMMCISNSEPPSGYSAGISTAYTMILTQDGNVYHTGESIDSLAPVANTRTRFAKVTNLICG